MANKKGMRRYNGEWTDGLNTTIVSMFREHGFDSREKVYRAVVSGELRPGKRDKEGKIVYREYGKLNHQIVLDWFGL